MYATGDHSLQGLQQIMTTAGLLSRKGNEYSLSNVHNVLTNPFYYGVFKFNGEPYQGSHEPIITKETFDRVQHVLNSKSRPRGRSHKEYAFRGIFMCGECGCAITSETQKGHSYYRCTKKRISCSQKYVREEVLAQHISTMLQKIAIPAPWADLMLEELDREANSGTAAKAAGVQKLKAEIKQCDERLETLLDAHLDKVLSRDEYLEEGEGHQSQGRTFPETSGDRHED